MSDLADYEYYERVRATKDRFSAHDMAVMLTDLKYIYDGMPDIMSVEEIQPEIKHKLVCEYMKTMQEVLDDVPGQESTVVGEYKVAEKH